MKTWEQIHDQLKCLPTVASLHRLAKNRASHADEMLIAMIACDDLNGVYKLTFNPEKKFVSLASEFDGRLYRRITSHYLPDVFIGN